MPVTIGKKPTINGEAETNCYIMQTFFFNRYFSDTKFSDAKEILYLAQEINTVPTSQLSQIVSESIKHAGHGVAQFIFDTDWKHAEWGETDCSPFRDELAVKLIAWTLTKVGTVLV